MVQSKGGRSDGSTAASDTDSVSLSRASTVSKRQREGTGNIGAFGKRTGNSDLVFLEAPRGDGDD